MPAITSVHTAPMKKILGPVLQTRQEHQLLLSVFIFSSALAAGNTATGL